MLPSEGERAGLRASDGDRERTVDVLRAACGEGRITLDEFSDRVGEAYAARTLGELAAVTTDLPTPALPANGVSSPPPIPGVPAPPSPRAARSTQWVVGILGAGGHHKGRWRVGERVGAVAFMGGVELDLRRAEIGTPVVDIDAVAIMGGVEIVVPEGIEVEMTGVAIMGGKECRVKDVQPRPGAPVVRVRVFAFWGAVTVRSKPSTEEERVRREARAEARRVTAQARRVAHEDWHRHRDDIRRRAREIDAGELVRSILDQVMGGGSAPDVPAAPDGTVTLLFSDIVGFTAMTERLGDLRAQAILRDHNTVVRRRIQECGGHEVKALGDSFMVAFTSASRALRCAISLQRDFAGYRDEHPEVPLHLRLGLHTGEAIREEDDLFGRTVIVASRIADAAGGDEILVSSLLMQLCESSGEFTFDEGRELELKGLSQPWRVHALKWEPA